MYLSILIAFLSKMLMNYVKLYQRWRRFTHPLYRNSTNSEIMNTFNVYTVYNLNNVENNLLNHRVYLIYLICKRKKVNYNKKISMHALKWCMLCMHALILTKTLICRVNSKKKHIIFAVWGLFVDISTKLRTKDTILTHCKSLAADIIIIAQYLINASWLLC